MKIGGGLDVSPVFQETYSAMPEGQTQSLTTQYMCLLVLGRQDHHFQKLHNTRWQLNKKNLHNENKYLHRSSAQL